ncbi:MAG: transglutaminaseTgpA domain-containing protein [Chloroflexota bacterium]|nr:transglutaminaseTgpA domain-containing protein [Chloroflexota bacterium]
MTITANRPRPVGARGAGRWARWGDRLKNSWRAVFLPGDILTLLLTGALLLMPALALMATGWPLDGATVVPTALLSVLFGFLLARSRYGELFGLLVSILYGACVVLLIAAINQPDDLWRGIYNVFERLTRWLVDATSGGINPDDLVFTLLVASLFWFLGHNLAWHVFRVDRLWRAILPPALILFTNAVYYVGEINLDGYIVGFIFIALLLAVRSSLDAREWDWYLNGVRVPRRLRRQFFTAGAVLALVVLSTAWAIPRSDVQERLQRFQEFLQSEPLTQLAELWNRLVSSAETQGPTTADYYGGDSLQLGGAIRLGDERVFLVNVPRDRRYYWRSRVFDTYDGGRWTSVADTRLNDPEAPLDIIPEAYVAGARTPVNQTFTMGLNASRLIYTAPQPLRIDLATRTDLRYLPDQSMAVSVIRPFRVIYEGESYTVTSLLSSASADQLRAAGTTYPEWITNVYNGYIPSASSRTIQLANQIVRDTDAQTPYDQAKAIEAWLRLNIRYNESIPQPPVGQDPVDWVLFDGREGYCNYYASSMVVMLRVLGVPARMAAGFAQGEWNDELNAYVVLERDAHTWVEVYFPGYGWVEFEPTAAQTPLNRDDTQPQPLVPPPTQFPTATATPSPTPTETPSPTLDPALAGEARPTDNAPTVTPSPTLTPTAVLAPTEMPPTRPQPRDPFGFLLPALGAVLIGIVIVLLLLILLVFLYWWWEWRGMRGLSPITRAYARLERYIGLLGLHLNPRQTPEERRQQIVKYLPPAAEPPVSAITRLYTVERYGRPAPIRDEVKAKPADKAWSSARSNILKRWLRRKFVFWRKS